MFPSRLLLGLATTRTGHGARHRHWRAIVAGKVAEQSPAIQLRVAGIDRSEAIDTSLLRIDTDKSSRSKTKPRRRKSGT
jgi:hypothetical protein